METINSLPDLLLYNIQLLYSAEETALKAMPVIIEKVQHSSLRNALSHHAGLTGEQIERLKKIPALVHKKSEKIALLTLGSDLPCKGLQGLIDEANDLLQKDLSKDVTDAAIIECVQKIEHYEICTYGTALTYAKELNLREVENLLNETLQEEYDADDLLTALATAALNKEAIPEDFEGEEIEDTGSSDIEASRPAKVSISERTVNSPGGRAGTSHRRYGSGESRGH